MSNPPHNIFPHYTNDIIAHVCWKFGVWVAMCVYHFWVSSLLRCVRR